MAAKTPSSSASESEGFTGLSSASPSSKQNWSNSVSRDRREKVVSSLEAATSQGKRWRGSSTGERSFRAKKPGTETSMQANLGSPAFIAWLASWYALDKGSSLRIKWITCNCLSSLINISDLSSLLRPGTLTRLSLKATCPLSAKTSEEEIRVRSMKINVRKR